MFKKIFVYFILASLCVWVALVFTASSGAYGFQVLEAVLKADDGHITGICPAEIVFHGYIRTNGPGIVRYTFVRSDGVRGPELTLVFKESDTKAVTASWALGSTGPLPAAGDMTIRIISPNPMQSSTKTGSFTLDCKRQSPGAQQAQPRSGVPQPGTPRTNGSQTGRFLVTLNGFHVNHQTKDDALERDGVGDEVYLISPTLFLCNPTGIVDGGGGFGPVHGQKRDPGTVQAGSATPTGGLRTGDSFPTSNPETGAGHPISPGFGFPFKFYEGDIIQGQTAVVIVPSLWEWDNNDNTLHDPFANVFSGAAARANLLGHVTRLIHNPPSEFRGCLIRASGLRMPINQVSIGHGPLGLGEVNNRPIGMIKVGDRYVFDPTMVVLTYESANMIARMDFGHGPGIFELRFTDDHDLEGDYTLFVQVKRIL